VPNDTALCAPGVRYKFGTAEGESGWPTIHEQASLLAEQLLMGQKDLRVAERRR